MNYRILLVKPDPFILLLPEGTTDNQVQAILDTLEDHNLGASGWKDVTRERADRLMGAGYFECRWPDDLDCLADFC